MRDVSANGKLKIKSAYHADQGTEATSPDNCDRHGLHQPVWRHVDHTTVGVGDVGPRLMTTIDDLDECRGAASSHSASKPRKREGLRLREKRQHQHSRYRPEAASNRQRWRVPNGYWSWGELNKEKFTYEDLIDAE